MTAKKREKVKHLGRGLQSLLGPVSSDPIGVDIPDLNSKDKADTKTSISNLEPLKPKQDNQNTKSNSSIQLDNSDLTQEPDIKTKASTETPTSNTEQPSVTPAKDLQIEKVTSDNKAVANIDSAEKSPHSDISSNAVTNVVELPPIKKPDPIEPKSSKFPEDKQLKGAYKEILVDLIVANPYQPRSVWDENELQELADSIAANGIVQPIIIRPYEDGYQLIAGERRFRAAQLAGLEKVPALVRQATDEQMLELALVENIHRANLNPIERAKAYQNYVKTFSLTHAEAGQRLGENRSVITNYLRLLELPFEIQQMLTKGQLSMGHARAILALPGEELKRKLANKAMAGRLSVREVEKMVRQSLTDSGQQKQRPRSKAPHILDLESSLSSQLGTRVAIDTRKNGQRGKITIEFYSLREFERITERLGLNTIEEV